jgi:hypothetical protein
VLACQHDARRRSGDGARTRQASHPRRDRLRPGRRATARIPNGGCSHHHDLLVEAVPRRRGVARYPPYRRSKTRLIQRLAPHAGNLVLVAVVFELKRCRVRVALSFGGRGAVIDGDGLSGNTFGAVGGEEDRQPSRTRPGRPVHVGPARCWCCKHRERGRDALISGAVRPMNRRVSDGGGRTA